MKYLYLYLYLYLYRFLYTYIYSYAYISKQEAEELSVEDNGNVTRKAGGDSRPCTEYS